MNRRLLAVCGTTILAVATIFLSGPVLAGNTPPPSPTTGDCAGSGQTINERTASFVSDSEAAFKQVSQIRTDINDFYTAEGATVNLKVANYEALTKQLNTAQAVVQKSLDKAHRDLGACPLTAAAVSALNGNVNGVSQDLKAYRGRVLALLVTVRTADVAARKPTPRPSPSGPPVLP